MTVDCTGMTAFMTVQLNAYIRFWNNAVHYLGKECTHFFETLKYNRENNVHACIVKLLWHNISCEWECDQELKKGESSKNQLRMWSRIRKGRKLIILGSMTSENYSLSSLRLFDEFCFGSGSPSPKLGRVNLVCIY